MKTIRTVAKIGDQDEEIVEGIENAEGIPESTVSLRKVAVPGTRNWNQSHTPIG
jgi:hypothetical protein